jgi:hopanoid biosynthesis associated radical SAM protein HpnJ
VTGSYRPTLFLHPPSTDGFDGGAGARYQARREIRSFWYPTWLAHPAALVPGSRLVDAPPDGLGLDDVVPIARDYDLCVIHTSTPSFAADARAAAALRAAYPRLVIGMVGPAVGVAPEASLRAAPAVDFVTRGEFDLTVQEVAQGRPLSRVAGLTYRAGSGLAQGPDRPPIENLDALPFVIPIYKRDLTVEHYAIGYLRHPYVSLYTGRGCRSRCTFCLWPQTVGGQRYRTRSPGHVAEEMALARRLFPQVREFFFDDDTFTDDLPRAEAIAGRLGRLGLTWSVNAKANVPYETLKALKDGGLRLLLVGYESGSQTILNNIRKGLRLDRARQFARDARRLGIAVHGTFILGLPGETRETIAETIRFACEVEPDTIQVSLAAPYPGTALFEEARRHGWLESDALVDGAGVQVSALGYPHLPRSEIFASLETFYRQFYFRPRKMISLGRAMLGDPALLRRRLGEGRQFLRFLAARRRAAAPGAIAPARQPVPAAPAAPSAPPGP